MCNGKDILAYHFPTLYVKLTRKDRINEYIKIYRYIILIFYQFTWIIYKIPTTIVVINGREKR